MSSLTLTQAEADLIEANRASLQAAEDKKTAEEAIRAEKIEKQQALKVARIETLRDALDTADTNGITYQTEEGGDLRVFFLLDGREEEVNIEQHRVSTNSGWSARNAGMKYKLWGSYNNYSNRYYTNPKTVIKKIVELQKANAARKASAELKLDLSEQAVAILTRKNPKADVAFQKGYDYRNNRNRYSGSGNYQPDHVTVTTPNGTVEYTYRKDDKEGLLFSIRARRPSKEISDKITALILG